MINFKKKLDLLLEGPNFLINLKQIIVVVKVVPVWEFPKMTSREFPGISRFFREN